MGWGLSYCAISTLFCAAFIANVSVDASEQWFVSSGTSLAKEAILDPIKNAVIAVMMCSLYFLIWEKDNVNSMCEQFFPTSKKDPEQGMHTTLCLPMGTASPNEISLENVAKEVSRDSVLGIEPSSATRRALSTSPDEYEFKASESASTEDHNPLPRSPDEQSADLLSNPSREETPNSEGQIPLPPQSQRNPMMQVTHDGYQLWSI